MATQAIQDILDTEIPPPSLAFRPSRATPVRSDMTFGRASAGWTRDPVTEDYVKRTSGTPRLYGNGQPLLLEPQRTQLHNDPTDVSAASWVQRQINITSGAGTALGRSYQYIEADANAGKHEWTDEYPAQDAGAAVGAYSIVEAAGITEFAITIHTTDGTNTGTPTYSFDLTNGGSVLSGGNPTYGTTVTQRVVDLGEGWVMPIVVLSPDAGFQVDQTYYTLQKNGSRSFTGGNGNGVNAIAHQTEQCYSQSVTSPIFQSGGTTRNADSLTIQNNGFWNTNGPGALYFEYEQPEYAEKTVFYARLYRAFGQSALSRKNEIIFYTNYDLYISTSQNIWVSGVTPAPGETSKVVVTWGPNSTELTQDGADRITFTEDRATWNGVDLDYIDFTPKNRSNYYLHDFRYYPFKLSQIQRVSLTAN